LTIRLANRLRRNQGLKLRSVAQEIEARMLASVFAHRGWRVPIR
jgi:hypothetical protein